MIDHFIDTFLFARKCTESQIALLDELRASAAAQLEANPIAAITPSSIRFTDGAEIALPSSGRMPVDSASIPLFPVSRGAARRDGMQVDGNAVSIF